MRLLQAEAAREVQFARAGRAFEEGADHLAVLGRQHRAGGIEQHAADVQGRPQRIEHLALQRGKGGDVIGLARQLDVRMRSEEHTSELQSLMRISYAVFCLKKKT